MHWFEDLSRAIPVDRIDEEIDRQRPRIDTTDIISNEERRNSICLQGRTRELRLRPVGELGDSLHGRTIPKMD
jgi:hypothetical protein